MVIEFFFLLFCPSVVARLACFASQMSLVVSEQTGNVPLLLSAPPDTVLLLKKKLKKISRKMWLCVCKRRKSKSKNVFAIRNVEYVRAASACSVYRFL